LAVLAVIIALVTNRVVEESGFSYGWLISAPSVGAAFALLLGVFDVWAWRWRWLHRLGVVTTPVVDGTYEGTIRSNYAGTTLPIRVVVDQRWLGIMIRFEVLGTTTSTSTSMTAAVYPEGHHDAQVTYTYSNRIRPGIASDDMADHDGTADVRVTPDGRMTGRYFNLRGRQGILTLERMHT
jgi:MFS family permease